MVVPLKKLSNHRQSVLLLYRTLIRNTIRLPSQRLQQVYPAFNLSLNTTNPPLSLSSSELQATTITAASKKETETETETKTVPQTPISKITQRTQKKTQRQSQRRSPNLNQDPANSNDQLLSLLLLNKIRQTFRTFKDLNDGLKCQLKLNDAISLNSMIVDLYDDKAEINDDLRALLVELIGNSKATIINGNEVKDAEEKKNEKKVMVQEDHDQDEKIDTLITTLIKHSSGSISPTTQSHLNHLHLQLQSYLTHSIHKYRTHSHIPRKSPLDPTYLNSILLSKTLHNKRLKYINRLKQKLSRPNSAKLGISSNGGCLIRTPWNETLKFKGEGLVFGFAEREVEKGLRGLSDCDGYADKWRGLVEEEQEWEKLIAGNGGQDKGDGKKSGVGGPDGDWEFVFREPVKQFKLQKRKAEKQKEQFNKKLGCIYGKLKPEFDSMFINSRVNFQRLLIELQLHHGGGEGGEYLDVAGDECGDLGELLKKHGFVDPLRISSVVEMKTRPQLFKDNPFGDELNWTVKEEDLKRLKMKGVRMSLEKKKEGKGKMNEKSK
ncbi:unnamed protein product [Ambrosiozyma monospora]|uniref:Unnamed protein product n=1 Tax=Ambrosiozyma monospora TaxID=43982 RepID=A0A9W6Z466_AMBMO|nr:unnamed protein product [Ambrosiozyma monospora]